MKYRQWKKNYKKRYGFNPPKEIDKRRMRKAQQSEIINYVELGNAIAEIVPGVIEALGRVADSLSAALGKIGETFRAAAAQYKKGEV